VPARTANSFMRGDDSAEHQPSQIEVANNTTSNLFDAASPTLHIIRGRASNGLRHLFENGRHAPTSPDRGVTGSRSKAAGVGKCAIASGRLFAGVERAQARRDGTGHFARRSLTQRTLAIR